MEAAFSDYFQVSERALTILDRMTALEFGLIRDLYGKLIEDMLDLTGGYMPEDISADSLINLMKFSGGQVNRITIGGPELWATVVRLPSRKLHIDNVGSRNIIEH